MKILKNHVALICLLVLLFSCRKDTEQALVKASASESNLMATAVPSGYPRLTVKTISGVPEEPGYVDGSGNAARLAYPEGLDLLPDGSLYVADHNNHKIRKVSQNGEVSTVTLPGDAFGTTISSPRRVRVQKDGTINILCQDGPFTIAPKVWIIKPGGEVLTPPYKNGPVVYPYSSYYYNDLQREPYHDQLFIAGSYVDGYAQTGIIEQFIINEGAIGAFGYTLFPDSLAEDAQTLSTINAFFCGYNNVKYIVVNGKAIYKWTSKGVFTQIFRDLKFTYISSIVVNRNSKSIYVADNGSIKSISNGKLQYLAGPHPDYHGKDGVGREADVKAEQLALAKNEASIFFTDRNSVRQIFLR
ncbi:hypothetical protein GS399_09865 [Pedobacter sp. HMF7647]|uniref:6-bladed beta-propeller n=1 Tax=Hufsiella arboris TaxID=2695275 RepID=A0A7K1Y9L7_9SPHI|nr:hypothetical protein [Hufsiella arboris]MXV51274.1 hypothetical protein [Hufsiella arboris]